MVEPAALRKRVKTEAAGIVRKVLPSTVVRLMFVQDPQREGQVLVEEEDLSEGRVRRYITCRICKGRMSFAKGSYTAAANHLVAHRLTTEAHVLEALSWAEKSEAEGRSFPLDKLPEGEATGQGGKPGAQVTLMERFVRPVAYAQGSTAWKGAVTATAKWIAADCLPFRIVESESFRSFARHLEPRFPSFTRKAVTSEVSFHIVLRWLFSSLTCGCWFELTMVRFVHYRSVGCTTLQSTDSDVNKTGRVFVPPSPPTFGSPGRKRSSSP